MPTVQEQTSVVLTHAAGYASHRTIAIGLRSGLLEALAASGHATPDELAERLGMDPFYVSVWCRAAFAAGVCERDGDRYRLAAHMATLLLDTGSPAYAGGVFTVLEQPEMFGRFEDKLASGERLWWDQTSPDWIAGVTRTGTPFYTRLIPGGLQQIPGLPERLAAGATVVDSACGTGIGLVRLAHHYPGCQVVGVDGDAHSIEQARKRIAKAGLAERVTLVCSPLEELRLEAPAALVVNNNLHARGPRHRPGHRARPRLPGAGGLGRDLRLPVPRQRAEPAQRPRPHHGRHPVFEAQIDDQLLPRAAYDDLLSRHGFTGLGAFSLTPMHAVTYARRP
jgi:SAM-dependent methyltransferase